MEFQQTHTCPAQAAFPGGARHGKRPAGGWQQPPVRWLSTLEDLTEQCAAGVLLAEHGHRGGGGQFLARDARTGTDDLPN